MFFPTFPLASSFDDLLVDEDEEDDEDLFFPAGNTQQQQEQQLRQDQLDQLQQQQQQQQQPLVAEEIPEDFLEALESLQINPETSIVPKKIPTVSSNDRSIIFSLLCGVRTQLHSCDWKI